MPVYHRDIGLPVRAQMPSPGLSLDYSRHALDEAADDDVLDELPARLPPVFTVVEVRTLESGAVQRWLVRVPCFRRERGHWLDLMMSVTPAGSVRTVWLNVADDLHATLDVTRYAKP